MIVHHVRYSRVQKLGGKHLQYRPRVNDYSIHIDTICLTNAWMITIKHLLCFFAQHLSFLFFSYEICRCVNVHVYVDTVRHSAMICNAITSCEGSCQPATAVTVPSYYTLQLSFENSEFVTLNLLSDGRATVKALRVVTVSPVIALHAYLDTHIVVGGCTSY